MFTKLLRFPVFASAAAAIIVTQGILAAQTPGLSHTATWNAGAETFIAQTIDVTDTASAAGSLLARWRVGAATMFSVSKAGALVLAGPASFTGGTFTTTLTSTTAQATLGAMAATQGSFYASTVSGATLQGYGTTADVTLKNRAGTDVLKIGPNTTAAVFAGAVTSTGDFTCGASTFVVTAATGAVATSGALAITGALTGVTDLTATGSILNQKTGTGASIIEAYNPTSGLDTVLIGNGTGGAVYGVPASNGGVGTRSNAPFVIIANSTVAATFTGANTVLAGTLRLANIGAFVASDKYLVIDASGNVHVSALGPAS